MSRRKKSKLNIIVSASLRLRSDPNQEKQDKKQKPVKKSRATKLPDLPAAAVEAFDKLYALKIPEPVLWLGRETEKQKKLVLDTQLDQDQENWDGTKYLKARIDSGLRVLIKFLAGIDAIGRDTWQKVEQTVSPEFIREVLLQKALGFIDAHEGIIKKQLNFLAPPAAVKDLGPVLRHLEASYGRLRNKMHRLYEIKALEVSVSAQKKLQERAASPPATVGLDEHEKKVWEVIKRGQKGRQYCRELGNAHINPRRTGSWKECPGTYLGAYDEGGYWRQRVQDEKSKIRRKAEQLAQHSQASKNSSTKKPV